MTGHAFQCVLKDEEIEASFRAAARLLSEGSIFTFETLNPATRPWDPWNLDQSQVHDPTPYGVNVRVWHDLVEVGGDTATFNQHHEFRDTGEVISSRITLRFLTLEQLIRYGLAARLHLRWAHGDWDVKPFDATDREIIVGFSR